MNRTIRVDVIKLSEWSYSEPIKFEVSVRATPEFMREPEFAITEKEKIEIIAEQIKLKFIEKMSENIL
jgi:hypothetical protein